MKKTKAECFIRKCPNPNNNVGCKVNMDCKNRSYYNNRIKNNRVCKSCATQIREWKKGNFKKPYVKMTVEERKRRAKILFKDKIPWNKGKTYEELYGKERADELKRKYKIARMYFNKNVMPDLIRGEKNPAKRLDVREKLRMNYVERVKRLGRISPFYNPKACEFIRKYGFENNYEFKHAMNGGEFYYKGYFLDGYDEKNNVVIEYYEKHHYVNGKLGERELIRELEIKKGLNCKFIRVHSLDEKNIWVEIL